MTECMKYEDHINCITVLPKLRSRYELLGKEKKRIIDILQQSSVGASMKERHPNLSLKLVLRSAARFPDDELQFPHSYP